MWAIQSLSYCVQAAQYSARGGVVVTYTSTSFAFAQAIAYSYSSYATSASATATVSTGTAQASAFASTAAIAGSQASAVAISSAYVSFFLTIVWLWHIWHCPSPWKFRMRLLKQQSKNLISFMYCAHFASAALDLYIFLLFKALKRVTCLVPSREWLVWH